MEDDFAVGSRVIVGSSDLALSDANFYPVARGESEWVKVDVGVDTFIVSDPFRISSDVHFNFSKKSRLLGTM